MPLLLAHSLKTLDRKCGIQLRPNVCVHLDIQSHRFLSQLFFIRDPFHLITKKLIYLSFCLLH